MELTANKWVPETMRAGVGICGATLAVTLESSDNTYLNYPVDGYLFVTEITSTGHVNTATFCTGDPGKSKVLVRNPVFRYGR